MTAETLRRAGLLCGLCVDGEHRHDRNHDGTDAGCPYVAPNDTAFGCHCQVILPPLTPHVSGRHCETCTCANQSFRPDGVER